MPESWQVPLVLDGERIDRALALLTGLSRRDVNGLLDAGRVTIGGQPVSARSRKVRVNERLAVEGDVTPSQPPPVAADPTVEVPVVWSDDDLIVVDKPAGLVVHPGAGNREATLVHGLLARFPDLAALAVAEDQADRPGIVHRLDKGTSGLLVIARTPESRASLVNQLAARTVSREYVTLVSGTVESDHGLIDAPLGRGVRDPTRFQVQMGGRPARTAYEVEARYDGPTPVTLLRCTLQTGRTHQIRVHLASIGHPVVGDERYGTAVLSGWRPLPPGRFFLHAAELAFDHPRTLERCRFSSPLPEDLQEVLSGVSHLA